MTSAAMIPTRTQDILTTGLTGNTEMNSVSFIDQ